MNKFLELLKTAKYSFMAGVHNSQLKRSLKNSDTKSKYVNIIDWDKVNSVDDIKAVLKLHMSHTLQTSHDNIRFSSNAFNRIPELKNLVKKEIS